MLLDNASRWSVLAFASAHVAGLLTHHPVPWSGTLTAVSLLVVAFAATVRTAPGTLRTLALLAGLTAVAGLVAEVDYRGGGLGWPFFLTEPPDDLALVEAVLLAVAAAGLSTAALLPAHGVEDRLGALRAALTSRPRAGLTARPRAGLTARPRAGLTARPRAGLTARPRAGLTARPRAGLTARPRAWYAHRRAGVRTPRRGLGRWRPRLATAGTVTVTALVAAVATAPMWRPDHYGQIPLFQSRDRAGLLLATVPVLLAVLAATLAACLLPRRPLPRSRRAGVTLAAVTLVALTVPVGWERGGDSGSAPNLPRRC